MARPFFSVVIVNFNYGRFLAQAVESLLGQDFPAGEREIIVVDDRSTDDSVRVAESFGDKIRLFVHESNQRQSGAFRTGFAQARGEVLCLLDADDYCHPDKLKAYAERLEDPAIGIVQHQLRDVDAAGRELNNPIPRWPQVYTLEDFLDGRTENAATSGLAFRRSVLERLLPVPEKVFCWYDEYLIAHGLFLTKMANVSRVLGYHRMHGANNWAHRLHNPDQLEAHVREGYEFYGYLKPKLEAAGRDFTPRFKALQEIDFKRRLLIVAMHRGRRAQAWGYWKELSRAHGRSRFGLFKSATLLLALIHPQLYLLSYKAYSSDSAFRRLRSLLLPE